MDHNHFNDGGVAINFAELARSTHASESAIRQSVDRLVRHGVLIERRGAFGDEPIRTEFVIPAAGDVRMKAATTGGLLDQYKLLGAIIDTPWATRLDHKVARHVIDRYYPKHGNGRASLRYLERATGSSRSNITTSLRRLADHGAIVMVRQGQGTRPTEFALNFEFPASGTADVTTIDGVPSVPVGVTGGGDVGMTSSSASVPVGVTESYLNPAYKAEIQIDRNDTRPPTAPPLADGRAAPAAGGSAVEEEERAPIKPTFELCWRTYDYPRGKKEARAAWNALPPDTDLAAVIEAAAAWQQSWAAQGKPDAPRFTLARWLKDERYDEDAPKGFIKVERGKAKSKSTGKREFGIGANIKHFTIVGHETDGSPFAEFFETFTFRADDGQEFSKRMHVVSATAEFAEGADVELKNALHNAAFGKGNIQEDFVGRVVARVMTRDCASSTSASLTPRRNGLATLASSHRSERSPATILDSGCEWNEHGQFVTLMLDVADTSGDVEINRQVDHTFDMETAKGQAFLASICRAVGIKAIEDTDVLHGRALECTITGVAGVVDQTSTGGAEGAEEVTVR